MILTNNIGRLRIAALIEGVTCIALYGVAMPFKYIGGIDEAVRIPGIIHGVFFIAYLILLLPVYKKQKWAFKKLFICGIASVVPFMTFWVDYKYFKSTANT